MLRPRSGLPFCLFRSLIIGHPWPVFTFFRLKPGVAAYFCFFSLPHSFVLGPHLRFSEQVWPDTGTHCYSESADTVCPRVLTTFLCSVLLLCRPPPPSPVRTGRASVPLHCFLLAPSAIGLGFSLETGLLFPSPAPGAP